MSLFGPSEDYMEDFFNHHYKFLGCQPDLKDLILDPVPDSRFEAPSSLSSSSTSTSVPPTNSNSNNNSNGSGNKKVTLGKKNNMKKPTKIQKKVRFGAKYEMMQNESDNDENFAQGTLNAET